MAQRKPIAKIMYSESKGGELRIIIPLAVASAILEAISGHPLPGHEPAAIVQTPRKPHKVKLTPRGPRHKRKTGWKAGEASP